MAAGAVVKAPNARTFAHLDDLRKNEGGHEHDDDYGYADGIALFIEAIVNALKPIWQEDGEKMTASEYVAMGFGVIFAVSCKINMLAYVVDVETAPWMNYFFYALTGIAIGRGTNFLYDLWEKMKQWQGKELIALDGVQQMHVAPAKTVNLGMAKWNLEALESFCAANGIDMTGCETKEDYMDAIEREFKTEN